MFDNKIVVFDAANDDIVLTDVDKGNGADIASSVKETSTMLLGTSNKTDELEM